MTRPFGQESQTIGEAVAYGVAGELDRGLELLQPIVDAGRVSTYALLAGLAEAAAFTALQNQAAGEPFVLQLENTATGQQASVDVLPPPLRFAGQFLTAWANRDQDTALALFNALADHSERTGSPDLGNAVSLIYDMAVATCTDVVRERRADRGGQGGGA
ncbi:hypothetical protein [Streptomyces olivaceus]|uniref:hypothetical protein n=1 Tax=Streptomyces olivaceus TaxID=47716 RepID=UPI00362D44A5